MVHKAEVIRRMILDLYSLMSELRCSRYHYYTWNYLKNSGEIVRNPNFDTNYDTAMNKLEEIGEKIIEMEKETRPIQQKDLDIIQEKLHLSYGSLLTFDETIDISFEEFMKKSSKRS